MNITVFGANGMLGFAVAEYLERQGNNVIRVSRNNFDIAKEDHSEIEQFLKESNYAVNCAGVIKPRIKDMSIENVLTVNSLFPKNFARICNKMGVKSFHVTTDCVYTGKRGNYDENDLFDADDLYGLSKNGGDFSHTMVLRTSIIGEEINQNRSLLEWAKSQKGKTVFGFVNHLWNGVTTLEFAKTIEHIIQHKMYDQKLYHIHSPHSVTKFELLEIFDRVYNLKLDIKARESADSVDRTLSSIYKLSDKIVTKSIETQVAEMKEFFEKVKQ